jgi:hypothetical protein
VALTKLKRTRRERNGLVERDHDDWVAAIVQAIQTGTTLDLAPGEAVDPHQADSWPTSRRLPGEALREAFIQPDIKADPRGPSIRAAYITGVVDLNAIRIPYSLMLSDCAFEQVLNGNLLTISGLLGLDGCVTHAVNLIGAEITGSAYLQRLSSTGAVQAEGAIFGGQLFIVDTTLTNEGRDALILDRAQLRGGAVVQGLSSSGAVRAVGATFGGPLILADTTLSNQSRDALILDRAEIRADALVGGLSASGAVRAAGDTFGGQLLLRDTTLTNEGGMR